MCSNPEGTRLMEIRTKNSLIEVEPLNYIFDELSNTWIEWPDLDPTISGHIENLYEKCADSVEKLRAAIVGAAGGNIINMA